MSSKDQYQNIIMVGCGLRRRGCGTRRILVESIDMTQFFAQLSTPHARLTVVTKLEPIAPSDGRTAYYDATSVGVSRNRHSK